MGNELDLRAPEEDSEKVGVGSQKSGRRSSFAEQDKFVTEWSYYPGDGEEAEGHSPPAHGRTPNNIHCRRK